MQWQVQGNPGDLIEVTINVPANVRFLDALNYEYYRRGHKFKGGGGWTEPPSAEFSVPYKGRFHVVVDLDGKAGEVKAKCNVTRI